VGQRCVRAVVVHPWFAGAHLVRSSAGASHRRYYRPASSQSDRARGLFGRAVKEGGWSRCSPSPSSSSSPTHARTHGMHLGTQSVDTVLLDSPGGLFGTPAVSGAHTHTAQSHPPAARCYILTVLLLPPLLLHPRSVSRLVTRVVPHCTRISHTSGQLVHVRVYQDCSRIRPNYPLHPLEGRKLCMTLLLAVDYPPRFVACRLQVSGRTADLSWCFLISSDFTQPPVLVGEQVTDSTTRVPTYPLTFGVLSCCWLVIRM
jgi:hypothetical protein